MQRPSADRQHEQQQHEWQWQQQHQPPGATVAPCAAHLDSTRGAELICISNLLWLFGYDALLVGSELVVAGGGALAPAHAAAAAARVAVAAAAPPSGCDGGAFGAPLRFDAELCGHERPPRGSLMDGRCD